MTARAPRLPISLDPLMAEAKRRARQRRLLVGLAAVAVVAAAAVLGNELGGLGSAKQVRANLTLLAVGQNGGRALFHLRCDPAAGNVANPAAACAAIASEPSLVTNPKPFYDWGNNIWHLTIAGRLDGKPVRYSSDIDWTTQMALIDKLGLGPYGRPLHLEALRHGSVSLGQTHTFAPGTLRPGDLVSCRGGHSAPGGPLSKSVPVGQGPSGYVGSNAGVIKVGRQANGAVVATCISRSAMPLDKRGRTSLP